MVFCYAQISWIFEKENSEFSMRREPVEDVDVF